MSSFAAPDKDEWSVDSEIMGYHNYEDHIIWNLLPFLLLYEFPIRKLRLP